MSTTQPQQQTYVPSKVLKTDYPVSAPVLLRLAARTGRLTGRDVTYAAHRQ